MVPLAAPSSVGTLFVPLQVAETIFEAVYFSVNISRHSNGQLRAS